MSVRLLKNKLKIKRKFAMVARMLIYNVPVVCLNIILLYNKILNCYTQNVLCAFIPAITRPGINMYNP